MDSKILGLSESKVQWLVNKYGCVINRKDFVPVVSVEWLEKYCEKNKSYPSFVNHIKLIKVVHKQSKIKK